ncbi:MAG TPA: biopolymer transporter ExbD [Candidatus Limnocylindrales bacterium]|nr:biopolymer transporter ExbD [Candidatus Limnocylindrales bacterium]
MSIHSTSRRGATAEMNVTPLIDVLLVLLIIFMVVLPHRNRGEYADIPLPPRDKPRLQSPDAIIVVQVRYAGQGQVPALKINEQEVPWDRLEARLRKIYEARADKVAFLKGDPDVDFEYVAQVVDITHRAGAERVGLMAPR